MAAAPSPLHRWKRFFPAFALIDDAIESTTGHPSGAFRSVRFKIACILRGAEDGGVVVAEELRAALDGAMEEALATLRVAASALPAASSATGLAVAVLALSERHDSPRVRGLARDVVHPGGGTPPRPTLPEHWDCWRCSRSSRTSRGSMNAMFASPPAKARRGTRSRRERRRWLPLPSEATLPRWPTAVQR
ncbi:unnamed protein product [Urochloa humidicola]